MSITYNNIIPSATSTNANPSYYRSNFIPTAQVKLNNKVVQVLDILSPAYLKVIKNIAPTNSCKYLQGQQLTTIANHYDNTTSSWYLYVILNGYFHPYQIEAGDTLYVPNSVGAINTNSTTNAAPTPSTVKF